MNNANAQPSANRATTHDARLAAAARHRLNGGALLATLLLGFCSCRQAPMRPYDLTNGQPLPCPAPTTHAYSPVADVAAGAVACCGAESFAGSPLPECIATDWAPPGIERPWPRDEYLCDGGDKMPDVVVNKNGVAHGLHLEDTVAHFDTSDGRRLVQESNRVCIYAPRFAAVRLVSGLEQSQQNERLRGVDSPMTASREDSRRLASATTQPLQAIGDTGVKQPTIQRARQAGGEIDKHLYIAGFQAGFLPHENFDIIRQGRFDHGHKAELIARLEAARVWTVDQAVQVILDRVQAVALTGDQRVQATYTVDLPHHPKLRVVKVASTNAAAPGETVDFTIRFDNIGDQTINNVTILDNLTTRLEYVAESAQASRDAEFSSQRNEGESLVLRWEFSAPLKPGDGGIVRFQCRVR